mgnify:CR=1 FL=1
MCSENNRNILDIRGIGEKRADLLGKLGIDSVDALLRFYPRDYHDYTNITAIADIVPGNNYCIKAKLSGTPKTENLYRKNTSRSTFLVRDISGQAKIILYHLKKL